MLDKLFRIIAGLASILGFGISILVMYSALRSNLETEFREVIILLSVSLAFLLFSVTFVFVYYFKESEKLMNLPKENLRLKMELKKNTILVFHSAEYLHNIAHYCRNLICEIESLEDPVGVNGLKEVLVDFDMFLITLTTNLQSYFSLFTGDHCSVTIKIAKNEESKITKVKTFYRDPISYRKRKISDKREDGKIVIYSVEGNTAYKVISSPKWKNTTFLSDDLEELWYKGEYENRTPGWKNFYNACAVVAISKKIDKNNRKILGFLCIDNDSGNLNNSLVENFLNGIADMLYILFEKYENIVKLALEKEIENESIRVYTDWDNSK